jgi:hypothetical protein
MSDGIDPKNLTAQLAHRGAGNPPPVHSSAAIANCFPGLEFDFRNVWRRILVGIELHEGTNLVVAVSETADPITRSLLGHWLLSVDGVPVVAPVTGPRAPGGVSQTLGEGALEWANAFADLLARSGGTVRCQFRAPEGEQVVEAVLEVRRFFHHDAASGLPTVVIERTLAEPGELTQSLCSPWQNDYRECACYYWAASRPDYVNVRVEPDGTTSGHNWLQRDRGPAAPRQYTLRGSQLLSYSELFRNWEGLLKFEIDGKDAE